MRLRIPTMLKKFATVVVPTMILGTITACAQNGATASADASGPEERKPVAYREHGAVDSASSPAPRAPDKPAQDPLGRMAQDLAQRLGVKASALQVLSVESVTWDDGALGCPQPGKSYIAAQVPGMRVLFKHDARTYQYHASERGDFVYCANPAAPAGSYDRQ
jgi:hypothetical protein